LATITSALGQIKSQLETYLPTAVIEQSCREAGHRWRRRKLDPALTVRLMILQLLAQLALTGLRHVSAISVSGEAIRKAKLRLPLTALMRLLKHLCPTAQTPQEAWRGLRVFIVDGMSFLTQDTPALAKRYGKARNGKKPASADRGRPAPKLLMTVDLVGGFVHQAIILPWARQERTCLARLLKSCGQGALLLADRGLGGYGQLAAMTAAGVHACIRLPRWLTVHGTGKANHRRIKRLGKQDLLVRWKKTRIAPWMSKQRWKQLPDSLELRQIAYRILRPGYRTHWGWIITTLTDPKAYPAEALVEVYGKRWQIEVCFRDLKKTLNLRQTTAKSIHAVRQQVLATLILYNLVRQIIKQAAKTQKVMPDRISFIDAVRWLLHGNPALPMPVLVVNPARRRPTQPRLLKSVPRKYGRLTKSRAALAKPPCQSKL
jgi:DDE family transposase